jgi:hypothetical protein
MTNGEFIRKHYMKDNENMAKYFMCIECPISKNCLEPVKYMINTNINCKNNYAEWLKFLNETKTV